MVEEMEENMNKMTDENEIEDDSLEEDVEDEIEREIDVMEFSLDDDDIEELIYELNNLKQSKSSFSYEVDEDNELLINYEASENELEDESLEKVLKIDEEDEPEDGSVVVAVSGYFDPVHKGHVEYFELAKNLGDKLVVILNNDKQCALKKGKAFMPLEDKKAILNSIQHIDDVFVSVDEDGSVCESLRTLKPNIFAKGGDRFSYEIPEAKVCEELGIKVVDSLGEKIQSSSSLIKNAEEEK